jgi:hypothetical protein
VLRCKPSYISAELDHDDGIRQGFVRRVEIGKGEFQQF